MSSTKTSHSTNLMGNRICSNLHHANKPKALRSDVANSLRGRLRLYVDRRSASRLRIARRFRKSERNCLARYSMIPNCQRNCCLTSLTMIRMNQTMKPMTIPTMSHWMKKTTSWNSIRKKNCRRTTNLTNPNCSMTPRNRRSNLRPVGRLPTFDYRGAT